MCHLVEAIQEATEQSGRMVDPSDYEPYEQLLYDGGQTTATAGGESDTEATGRTSDDARRPPASPESVVRTFFDRLDSGDPAVHELYHANAVVEQFSGKELRRAQQVEGTIAGELKRVTDEPSRVRIECVRKTRGSTTPVSVELRKAGDDWRLFDLTETGQQRPPDQ